jgi:hypothetical protein
MTGQFPILGNTQLGTMVLGFSSGSIFPTMVSASVNGTIWTITAALGVGGTGPMTGGVNGLTVSGVSVTLSNLTWSGVVGTATGSVAVMNGASGITLSYNAAAAGADIEDSADNDMFSFANLAVTNNTPQAGNKQISQGMATSGGNDIRLGMNTK